MLSVCIHSKALTWGTLVNFMIGLCTQKDCPRSLEEPVFMQGMLGIQIAKKTEHKCTTVVKPYCFFHLGLQEEVNVSSYQLKSSLIQSIHEPHVASLVSQAGFCSKG